MLQGRLAVTIQNVIPASPTTGPTTGFAEVGYSHVGRLHGGRNHDLVKRPGTSRAVDNPRQHGLAGEIHQHFARQPGASHAGLNYGNNLHRR
jgi:hypothetical protein